MNMLTVNINGIEYELAATLRVAYKVQGQNNHKPYTEVFAEMGDMHLEDQIAILYAAFECANPEVAKTLTEKAFLDYYLDHFNLKQVMSQLQSVIKGIMGTDDDEAQPEATQGESSEA